ncbi:MAG: hypothetical protein HFJ43_03530 [Clostridia bacterium]|nr:hypothetical protein [Clostridia bacterium]
MLKLFKRDKKQQDLIPSPEDSIMKYVREARKPCMFRRSELKGYLKEASVKEMATEYLYEQGHWMITARALVLKPLEKEKVSSTKNVLAMLMYYGEYDNEYICYGLVFFKKARKQWIYLGENDEKKMRKIPPMEENLIQFKDESGNTRKEPCQSREEYYFTW